MHKGITLYFSFGLILLCSHAISANKFSDQIPQNNTLETINNNNSSSTLSIESANADSSLNSNTDTSNTLVWPVFPSESLNHIARMFYPKSISMQKRFVAKTLELNPNLPQDLTPEKPFESPNLLIVPSLKSLALKSSTFKPAANKSSNNKKPYKSTFKISYNINQAFEKQTSALLDSYEELLIKNDFLKTQLFELIEKIGTLEIKLSVLKLTFDKTLQLSTLESRSKPTSDNDMIKADGIFGYDMPKSEVAESYIKKYWLNLVQLLGFALVVFLISHSLKKYRQREFDKFAQLQPTIVDKTIELNVSDRGPVVLNDSTELLPVKEQQKQHFEDTVSRDAHAIVASSLEEAKLLISINRNQDAITHLKSTIDAYPKLAIDHWLYLLEIFKKLNAKEDFEHYAKQLHDTLNVMTPVWYSSQTTVYVPQNLEEFPHIIENLQSVWPGALAKDYLRGLITDNRQGERTGFGKNVLSEILMLIELLDNRSINASK